MRHRRKRKTRRKRTHKLTAYCSEAAKLRNRSKTNKAGAHLQRPTDTVTPVSNSIKVAVEDPVHTYMTGPFQKSLIHLNPVKSLVQHHQTRMTLSFLTVLSAPPSESEKCPFNNVNCSHLT